MDQVLASIALDIGVFSTYTYEVPPELAGRVRPGVLVEVPFGRGNRVKQGFCIGPAEGPVPGMKAILSLVAEEPLISPAFIDICRWISAYYECPLGEVLAGLVPPGVRRRTVARLPAAYRALTADPGAAGRARGQAAVLTFLSAQAGVVPAVRIMEVTGCSAALLKTMEKRGLLARTPILPVSDAPVELLNEPVTDLTGEQTAALGTISGLIAAGGFGVVLVKGVTGSGKTELYIRAIREVIARGRRAILLVPEIMLTPQMSVRFGRYFPRLALIHSRLSEGERAAVWQAVREGAFDVVIGPRSALFAPVPDLGIIIVDEEHEHSFKQESAPRYHARDLAVYMGHQYGIPVILGSATPAMESLRNAERGRYKQAVLTHRVSGRRMPVMHVVDMAAEHREHRSRQSVSLPLRQRIEATRARGEQSIIFLNQRGFARFVFCPLCGRAVKCKNCDITLAYHRRNERYLCHYCGYATPAFSTCPACKCNGLERTGTGTQKLEVELAALLPGAVIQRVDSDSMTSRGIYHDVLARFARNEIQVLVGTQIVAKGLDFPNVTTVGIVGIENILHLPDFRSGERTFQMISQVAGRAGRGDKEGHVFLEVFDPAHPAIRCAIDNDPEGFYRFESHQREELNYPPFGSLVRIVIAGPEAEAARTHAVWLRDALRQERFATPVQILGPAEAPLFFINKRYRWHIILKVPGRIPSEGLFRRHDLWAVKGAVRVTVDVDPVSLL
ncbi:MAG: primosomal protein N' [Planctomycetota bacterium]